jgi:hypothetical protein
VAGHSKNAFGPVADEAVDEIEPVYAEIIQDQILDPLKRCSRDPTVIPMDADMD